MKFTRQAISLEDGLRSGQVPAGHVVRSSNEEGFPVLIEQQQIAERRDRAATMQLRVLKRPANGPYGDYTVKSGSGRTYRVAVRGPGLFENYCSCPDFAINTLGTCKHIILLPESVTQDRLAGAISGLLKSFGQAAAAAGGSLK